MSEVLKKFNGIILAAGFSMRMNEWKPQVKINGIPMAIHSINSMIQFCEKLILVGGFNYSELNELIRSHSVLINGNLENIIVIENKKYLNGMLSSVKCGLSLAGKSADGIFILPGDMPFVSAKTFADMVLQFSDDKYDVFIPAVLLNSSDGNNGKPIKKGHPVLINSEIVKTLLEDEQEVNFRNILKKFRQKICMVEDEGIFLDIDNSIDLAKAAKYFEKIIMKKEALID